MSDIADMILDGTLADDGSYQGGHKYDRYDEDRYHVNPKKKQCPHCNKWVKKSGLKQHIEAVHVNP